MSVCRNAVPQYGFVPGKAHLGEREMKRFAIVLIIALIIPTCIFAGRGLFDLTVGVTASTSYNFQKIQDEGLKDFDIKDLRFGADVETKFAFLAIDGKVFYDDANKGISGLVSANIAADIFFVRVNAGIGYQYIYNLDSKTFYFGNALDMGYATKFEDFKKANFDFNAGVDFLIGPVTVGAYATLPTKTNIENNQWGELFKALADNWKYAKIGVTVGFALL